jgi:carbamoyl-phosphate synthase large subunit
LDLGFRILATNGTARTLRRAGAPCEIVPKVSQAEKNVLEYVKAGGIDLIINVPTKGRDPSRDGYKIRRAAVEFGIPYITTLEAALASLGAIGCDVIRVNPLDALHARVAKSE